MEQTMNLIATALRRSKDASGLTVRSMAVKADVDQSQISQWMNGHVVPNAANLRKLERAELITENERRAVLLGEDAA
jgi:transcriptional regulator with XRE-family HTH domain